MFFGPYIAIGQKEGNIASHLKSKPTFFGGNKNQIISFQKVFILSKYHMFRLNLYDFFGKERVFFTPTKATVAASQLYWLVIKQ